MLSLAGREGEGGIIFRREAREGLVPAKANCLGEGGIAQMVEHLPCKQGVIGSNPITSTNMGS